MRRKKTEDEEEEVGTHGEGQDGGDEGSLVVARQFGQDAVQDGGELRSTRPKVKGHRRKHNTIKKVRNCQERKFCRKLRHSS